MLKWKTQHLLDDFGRAAKHRERTSRSWVRCVISPGMRAPLAGFGDAEPGPEHWSNPWYYGSVVLLESGSPFGNGKYAVISVSNIDETARHDWRDFQRIKNDLVGKEWEALELYPSESRLRDPSNRFYLWAFPPGTVLWGLPGDHRIVLDVEEAKAPQRGFP